MAANRVAVCIAFILGTSLAASAAGAQQAKLERGMKVVARSPDFVLRDGTKVIPPGSPFSIYTMQRVEGDRIRVHSRGREGEARASEVVPVERAEAYFSDQIKAKPRDAFGYLARCVVRLSVKHDLVNAMADCEEAIRLEPKNPWGFFLRGILKGEQGDWKTRTWRR